jgi:hypothetical protein
MSHSCGIASDFSADVTTADDKSAVRVEFVALIIDCHGFRLRPWHPGKR